jgi:FMN reductase
MSEKPVNHDGATSLVGVLGSVTPPGRLHAALGVALERAQGAETTLLDLGAVRVSFADGRDAADYGDDTATVVSTISRADAVVLASPVYRGTYTGALKNLLDLLPVDALRNKPVGIVAMGYTLHHYLGVEQQLRAVLAWFGALTAPTAVYLTPGDFEDGRVADAAVTQLDDLVATVIALSARARGLSLGPIPLAARHT